MTAHGTGEAEHRGVAERGVPIAAVAEAGDMADEDLVGAEGVSERYQALIGVEVLIRASRQPYGRISSCAGGASRSAGRDEVVAVDEVG
jgi:hypothetical protein